MSLAEVGSHSDPEWQVEDVEWDPVGLTAAPAVAGGGKRPVARRLTQRAINTSCQVGQRRRCEATLRAGVRCTMRCSADFWHHVACHACLLPPPIRFFPAGGGLPAPAAAAALLLPAAAHLRGALSGAGHHRCVWAHRPLLPAVHQAGAAGQVRGRGEGGTSCVGGEDGAGQPRRGRGGPLAPQVAPVAPNGMQCMPPHARHRPSHSPVPAALMASAGRAA